MTKYMYLPDKHGNITKCGAHDHNHCPYHLGPDGKPLKHYATPEAARKAYEAEQARTHSTFGLSKRKSGPKYVDYVPGISGIDDKFIPSQYRGLSMENLEKKLNENVERENKDREKNDSLHTLDKVMDMEKKLGVDASLAEPIKHMNNEIADYKRRVYQVFNGLQKESDKCDGDVKYSRSLLRKLEEAHPGADYGSKEKNGDVVCDNAKAYLKNHMSSLNVECACIEQMHGQETYEDDRNDLIEHETAINNIIDEMKGITGDTVPGDHIKVGILTDANNRTFSDYQEAQHQQNHEQAMQDHPEYAKLYNEFQSEDEMSKIIGRRAEKDYWFKQSFDHLKTMKPLKKAKSKEAMENVVLHILPNYRENIRKNCKAIAKSDETGEVLMESPNSDGTMNYFIYDSKGNISDTPLINYDEDDSDSQVFFNFPY